MEIRKVKITGINEIHPGDHICNRMSSRLWHHEIVTMTFPSRDMYEAIGFMIHDQSNHKCVLHEAMRIFTKVKNSCNEEIYRIEYQITDQTIRLYSNDEVVERAKMTFNGWERANKNYNLLENNCEHYATYCKCDMHVSFQVEALHKVFFAIGLLKPAAQFAATVAAPYGLAMAAGTLAALGSSALGSTSASGSSFVGISHSIATSHSKGGN